MLIFSQNGESAFDTTGSTIWIRSYSTDSYAIYARNCSNMEPIILLKTDSIRSAKNIIKAINAMAILGIPAVDLDGDIDDADAIVRIFEENKEKIYFDKYLGSIVSKLLTK